MTRVFRYLLLFVALVLADVCFAQAKQWQEMHKVKRSETIFGIAKKYGLTINELIKANPDMNTPGYELKKGDYIFIPYTPVVKKTSSVNGETAVTPVKTQDGAVNVGVVLPLHNIDGDGRRMTEYYRGLLMACKDLKKDGISVNVRAWNLPIDGDVTKIVLDKTFTACDVVFGPLYTKQVKTLADALGRNGHKLVIPFSINGNDAVTNSGIFQVYRSPELFYADVINQFAYRYSKYNVVVIDCNDKTSDKGVFTFPLRKRLAENGISCNITNIESSREQFYKAFSASKPNVVVLNTARSPELNTVIRKIENLVSVFPVIKVSMFGYTEWLMYEKYNKDNFFKYDVCIPSPSYYNSYSSKVISLENLYRSSFKCDMMDYLPRFAITGYDHGMFFIRGIKNHGKNFDGTFADKNAIQNYLLFDKIGQNGGFMNKGLVFVHYSKEKKISLIKF